MPRGARRVLLTAAALAVGLLLSAATARAERLDLGIITVKDQKLAQTLRQQLLKGASFEELARRHSVGPAAERGGRLGLVPAKRLRGEYRQALKGLPPNTPSPIVPTEEGYTILMRFAPRPAPAPKPAPAQAARPAPKPGHRLTRPMKIKPLPASQDAPYLEARRLVVAGVESLYRGDWQECARKFSQAKAKNPHEASADFFAHIATGAAEGRYKKDAVKSFADGVLTMWRGDPQEALKSFRQAFQEDPRLWQAALWEANLLADLGKPQQARITLGKVLAINPRSARAHISLGILEAEADRWQEAKRHFQTALKLAPDLADAYYQLAGLALVEGNGKQAESYLRQTLKHDPYHDQAWNDLGLLLARQRKGREAEKAFKRALELNPDLALAHLNLGQLYVGLKKLHRAVDEFKKALLVDPRLGAAHNNLAAAYILLGKLDQARHHAQMAKALGFPVSQAIWKRLKTKQNPKP